MNSSDIDKLLRQNPPVTHSPPGLETRIRAAVRAEARPQRRTLWPWFSVPAAAAIAFMIVLLSDGPKGTSNTVENHVSNDPAPPSPAEGEAVNTPVIARNPLRSEARALRNDAQRTGRFLLDCLPSMTRAE